MTCPLQAYLQGLLSFGLIDSTGSEVVKYRYDAWGQVLSTTGGLADSLGTLQPFRYRGYVYDEETGLYYLRSRHYHPVWGRFISPDEPDAALIATAPNSYAYCKNNPITCQDDDGEFSVLGFEVPYPGFLHIIVVNRVQMSNPDMQKEVTIKGRGFHKRLSMMAFQTIAVSQERVQ